MQRTWRMKHVTVQIPKIWTVFQFWLCNPILVVSQVMNLLFWQFIDVLWVFEGTEIFKICVDFSVEVTEISSSCRLFTASSIAYEILI